MALAIVVFSIANAAVRPAPTVSQKGGQPPMAPGIVGQVTAISGSMITMTEVGPTATATVAYTVDATNAIVLKNAVTSSLSGIAIGDRILVQGLVIGTSITAVQVMDGPSAIRPPTSTAWEAENHLSGSGASTPQHEGFFGWIGGFFASIWNFFGNLFKHLGL